MYALSAAVLAAALAAAGARELSSLQTQFERTADASTTYAKNVSSCPGNTCFLVLYLVTEPGSQDTRSLECTRLRPA
jgi:hypothetical protein